MSVVELQSGRPLLPEPGFLSLPAPAPAVISPALCQQQGQRRRRQLLSTRTLSFPFPHPFSYRPGRTSLSTGLSFHFQRMMELKLFGACKGNPAWRTNSWGVSKNERTGQGFEKQTLMLERLNNCTYIEIKG